VDDGGGCGGDGGTRLEDLLEDLEGGRLAGRLVRLLVLMQHLVDLGVGDDLWRAAHLVLLRSGRHRQGDMVKRCND